MASQKTRVMNNNLKYTSLDCILTPKHKVNIRRTCNLFRSQHHPTFRPCSIIFKRIYTQLGIIYICNKRLLHLSLVGNTIPLITLFNRGIRGICQICFINYGICQIFILWVLQTKCQYIFIIHTFRPTIENLGGVMFLAYSERTLHPITIHMKHSSSGHYSLKMLFIIALFIDNTNTTHSIHSIHNGVNFFLLSKFSPMKGYDDGGPCWRLSLQWNTTIQLNNVMPNTCLDLQNKVVGRMHINLSSTHVNLHEIDAKRILREHRGYQTYSHTLKHYTSYFN